jgi:HSP20 family molecular chaperone IbpA
MPMDAWRDGEQIVVQFDLPGVDLDSMPFSYAAAISMVAGPS